jgi:hypothetical protein
LWISLRPRDEELRDCGDDRLIYQQHIIRELVEQFGFDRTVFILQATAGRDRIPVVRQQLHQLIGLRLDHDYVIIQDVPEVRGDELYRYSWIEGRSVRSITE